MQTRKVVTGGKKINSKFLNLSYDIASGSEITPCIKIDKPLLCFQV